MDKEINGGGKNSLKMKLYNSCSKNSLKIKLHNSCSKLLGQNQPVMSTLWTCEIRPRQRARTENLVQPGESFWKLNSSNESFGSSNKESVATK